MSDNDVFAIIGFVIMGLGWLVGHFVEVSARGKGLSQDELKNRTTLKYGFIICGIAIGLIIISKSAGAM